MRVTASPSTAWGERTPAGGLDQPDLGRRAPATTVSSTRSAMVNGGRPSTSAAIGGRHRHRVPAVPGAHVGGVLAGGAAEHVGVGGAVLGAERLGRLAGGDRRGPRPAGRAAGGPPTQVLPTSVPVPTTTTSCSGRGRRSQVDPPTGWRRGASSAAGERRRPGRRCGPPTARPAAGRCPGATVGGRMAGTSRPWLEQLGRGGHGGGLLAEHDGDARGSGGRAGAGRRGRGAGRAGRRPRASASTPTAARAAAASAGAEGGGEDVGAGPVDAAARRRSGGRRRSRRGSRASSTACRPGARAGRRARSTGTGWSTAWASSSTSRASWRAHSVDAGRRPGRRRRPSRTPSRYTTTWRSAPGSASAAASCVEVAVAVHPQLGPVGPGQAAAVDDRGVVELVGVDAHPGRGRAWRARRGWRRSRWGTPRPPRCPASRRGRPRGRGGRAGTRRRGGWRRRRCPTARRRRWRRPSRAGCWERPR